MFYIHIEDVGKFWSDLNANLQPTSSLIDVFIVMMAISVVATICIQIGLIVVEAKQRKLWESIANNTKSNVQEDTMVDNNQNMANDKSNHDSKREQFENWIANNKQTKIDEAQKRRDAQFKAAVEAGKAEQKRIDEEFDRLREMEKENRAAVKRMIDNADELRDEAVAKANKPGLIERFGTFVFDSIDRVKSAVRKKALEVLGVESEISELKERIAQLELALDPTKVPEPQAATQADEEEEIEVVKEPRIVLPPRPDLFFIPEEPIISVQEDMTLELRAVVEELVDEADALRKQEPVNALEMLRNHWIAEKYESIPKKRPFNETRKAYLRLIS